MKNTQNESYFMNRPVPVPDQKKKLVLIIQFFWKERAGIIKYLILFVPTHVTELRKYAVMEPEL
jgi:hypothetical protein